MAWLRFEARSAERGWTGELPLVQYGAWTKLLCEVKLYGDRGTIPADYFTGRVLRSLKITPSVWTAMLDSAKTVRPDDVPALTESDGLLTVTNWPLYQPDPTHAERQTEYRDKRRAVTARDGTGRHDTSRDGSDDDGTVRDVTVRDVTGRDVHSASEKPVVPIPPRLRQVFEGLKQGTATAVDERATRVVSENAREDVGLIAVLRAYREADKQLAGSPWRPEKPIGWMVTMFKKHRELVRREMRETLALDVGGREAWDQTKQRETQP